VEPEPVAVIIEYTEMSNEETASFSRYLRQRVADVHVALAPLSEEDLNRAPDVSNANPPFVIATHVLGNVRSFVLGIACGQELRRDRPAEFRSNGTYEELGVAARKLSGEIDGALQELDPMALDDRFMPSQELWGEGEAHEISRREALIHALEHASIHLGHIQITVDLLRSGR
jgi:hypothetical protein